MVTYTEYALPRRDESPLTDRSGIIIWSTTTRSGLKRDNYYVFISNDDRTDIVL